MSKRKESEADKRAAIIAQALQEIEFARTYKQGRTRTWRANEDMYYGNKRYMNPAANGQTITALQLAQASRANVDLGQMPGFVHTILAKIDAALSFKFTKRKPSQLKSVRQLNSLKVADQSKNDWDIKDIAGKKQAVMYGRAIYSYFADSQDGYESHLDPIDVYDFLIDPSAGGLDMEKAMYLGDYGVVKSRKDIEQGVKDGIYLKEEAKRLLDGSGNSNEENQEEQNKRNRTRDTGVYTTDKEIGNKDKFKFWRWGTTYDGQRYYLLLSEKGATALQVEELEEVFESGLWWYWSWAAFVDLTEFWTPSFCDYVREVFMAQSVSINQMLDNAEQINKPQKVVNVGAIENLAELKYRRDGYIRVKKDFNVDQAVQTIKVASIDTPLQVFDKLDAIQEKASGVTAGSYGAGDNGPDEKVAIAQSNEENSADRFGFLNKSYSFGYKRFAKLWRYGVREHLVKRIAVDILGPNGVEIEMVSRRDIFRKDEEFNILVESSSAETALSEKEKQAKMNFLTAQAAIPQVPGTPPVQNPKKAYEIMAGIAGFDADTIRELQDTSDYGDADVMSEAERDIERLLDGEKFKPNQVANTAYKQRFVDYMQDNQENISDEQFKTLSNYVLLLDPIIMRNMTRQANATLFKQKMQSILSAPPTPPATPAAPVRSGARPIAPLPTLNAPPNGAAGV